MWAGFHSTAAACLKPGPWNFNQRVWPAGLNTARVLQFAGRARVTWSYRPHIPAAAGGEGAPSWHPASTGCKKEEMWAVLARARLGRPYSRVELGGKLGSADWSSEQSLSWPWTRHWRVASGDRSYGGPRNRHGCSKLTL